MTANGDIKQLEVVVVGAGAAGLGVAGELARRGIHPEVLESRTTVGGSWRCRYHGLRLNTVRWMSAVPGGSIPRSAGRWPSREAFAAHLEVYAAEMGIEPRLGVDVRKIQRSASGWRLEASSGTIEAGAVVIAAGYDRVPKLPDWPGRASFEGELIHARDYRDPGPYTDKDVLVVGTGNTGTEIATHLAHGGARRVRVAMRTPVNFMPTQILGIPITAVARLNELAPDWIVDRGGSLIQRLTVGNLTRFGMPQAPFGIATEMRVKGLGPVVDRGFVSALKREEVELVAAVDRFDGEQVSLADGSVLRPDAVIAATGYGHGLEGLVGHLGVLDDRGRPLAVEGGSLESAPGLYFNGYWLPFSGQLPAMRRSARRIARRIVRAGNRSS